MVKQGWESVKVKGDELLGRMRQLVHEGNVRRIIVKQRGRTVAEFPLSVGVVGAVTSPVLAAVGALAALVTECTLEIYRVEDEKPAKPKAGSKASR
jgi:hypothetical protein